MVEDFETIILQNSVNNSSYTSAALKLKPDFFENTARKTIFTVIQDYIKKYEEPPSFRILKSEIVKLKLDETSLKNIAVELLSIGSHQESNIAWLHTETEEWGRYRSMVLALNAGRNIVNGEDKRPLTALIDVIEQGLSFTLLSRVGHSYWDDFEVQADYYHSPESKYPFDIDTMNKLTRGGVTPATLNIVLGGIGFGKTTWLINMASAYNLQGRNVLYVSAEQRDKDIVSRIDVRLLGMTTDQILAMSKEEYIARLQKQTSVMHGGLYVVSVPTGSCTARDLKTIVKEYKIKFGITIDVIVADYIGIFKSYALPDTARSNSNLYGKTVAEEFRALGEDLNVPIWTGSQLNRDGQEGSNDISMKNVADSIGIMATADLAIIGYQTNEMIPLNMVKVKVIKNRYNNRNKIREFYLKLDNDLQLFSDASLEDIQRLGDVDVLSVDNMNRTSSGFGSGSNSSPSVKIPEPTQLFRNLNSIGNGSASTSSKINVSSLPSKTINLQKPTEDITDPIDSLDDIITQSIADMIKEL